MTTGRSRPVLACCAAAGLTALLGPGCASRSAARAAAAPEAAAQETRLSPDQVRMVQRHLHALEIPVDVTGRWDAQTKAGLVTFQERHGLPPTGRLDEDTRRALSLDPAPLPSGPRAEPGGVTRAPAEDRLEVAPPSHPDPQRDPAQNLPEIPRAPRGSAPGTATTPATRDSGQSYPAAFQACVDRELSRRGLNAFGDAPGTPAPEVADRFEHVTRSHPDIATVCGSAPW